MAVWLVLCPNFVAYWCFSTSVCMGFQRIRVCPNKLPSLWPLILL